MGTTESAEHNQLGQLDLLYKTLFKTAEIALLFHFIHVIDTYQRQDISLGISGEILCLSCYSDSPVCPEKCIY